jgi:phosphoglycolate phosphatase
VPAYVLAVFDLDGTLVDSRRDLADASNEMLASYGAAPLDEDAVGRMVGEGAGTLVTRLLAARQLEVPHAEALARYLAAYDGRLLDHTRPYDGIPEALDAIAPGARLAVLTNKPALATGRILEALDLRRRFEWVIGGDSEHGRKPDPAALHWLMGQAGVDARDTVMVGDSATDFRTARAAGATSCIVRFGFGFLNMPPGLLDGDVLIVDHPSEIPAALAAWRR